jgi:hypothetical protein
MRVLGAASGGEIGVALGSAVVAGIAAAVLALLYAVWKYGPTLLVAAGYVAFKWFSGGQWRHNYLGPRYVTRPVRAVGQTLLTIVAVAAVFNPFATVAVILAVAAVLGGTAVVTRRRARRVELPPLRARRVEPDAPRAVAGAGTADVGLIPVHRIGAAGTGRAGPARAEAARPAVARAGAGRARRAP